MKMPPIPGSWERPGVDLMTSSSSSMAGPAKRSVPPSATVPVVCAFDEGGVGDLDERFIGEFGKVASRILVAFKK